MTYTGTVHNGVVVLEKGADLPEGTLVQVQPARPAVEQSPGQPASADSEFWQDRPLDDILREQGVQPIANPRDLAIDWPEDDLDEFLAAVREARR